MTTRYTGIVKFFNQKKGFGFIVPNDGGRDVFVHVSALKKAGTSDLVEGDHVEFSIGEERGKMSAQDIKLLNSSSRSAA